MKKTCLITIYVATLLIGMMLLIAQAYSVRRIRHDDGISYLAATGHQGQYETSIPESRWVQAKQWQAFWTPDQFWCFKQIARDLAAFDIHPPLYFWLLHIWTSLHGVTLAGGPLLNVPFHLVACLMIAASCRLLGCSRLVAAGAGLLWLFAGTNLSVASEARQYSLLGAFSSLFIFFLLRFLRRPTFSAALYLCLTSAAGLLTHYHFILLLAACGGLVAIQALINRQWRTFFMIVISIAAAALLFVSLHPTFYLSFPRAAAQAQPFSRAEIPPRLRRVFLALIEQFVPHQLADPFVNFLSRNRLPILMVGVICGVVCIYLARRLSWRLPVRRIARLESVPIIGGSACFAAVALLYVSCRSPRHVMGAKYLMLVTPLIFIALGQVITWLTRSRKTWEVVAVVCLSVLQMTYGILVTRETVASARGPQYNPLHNETQLVLDSTARGVLPSVLWHADPAMYVFAASQKSLLSNSFPEPPYQEDLLYVSDQDYGNSEAGRGAVLQALSDHGFTVNETLNTGLWYGKTYRLIRAEQEGPGDRE
ncbi:MAG: glycosyltransferase family 39 protein [Anaerolineales bacterium]|nr:glycosyltransferase family 39 protein [Anaerolineales bacterium]